MQSGILTGIIIPNYSVKIQELERKVAEKNASNQSSRLDQLNLRVRYIGLIALHLITGLSDNILGIMGMVASIVTLGCIKELNKTVLCELGHSTVSFMFYATIRAINPHAKFVKDQPVDQSNHQPIHPESAYLNKILQKQVKRIVSMSNCKSILMKHVVCRLASVSLMLSTPIICIVNSVAGIFLGLAALFTLGKFRPLNEYAFSHLESINYLFSYFYRGLIKTINVNA